MTSTSDQEQNYRWADDGRRYMTHVPYTLPSDDQEVHRLDLQHLLLREAFNRNYFAPIDQPASILEVGCGSGRWMAEMAAEFPQAQILGIDLTLPTSESSAATFPSNCRFQRVNILDGLPFADHSFDFVHQRLLIFGLPANRWPSVVQELVRVTRPGGWIELVESGIGYRNSGPATMRQEQWLNETCQKRGIDIYMGKNVDRMLQDAGAVNVNTLQKTIPLGHWGGQVGSMALANMHAAKQTGKKLILSHIGISEEEYAQNIETWLQECEHYHTYMNWYIAYGQSPPA